MNINQASNETGISKDMIRFYEKKGIIHPTRKENNYRDYSTHDLHLLILIKQYNALGIPLSTIKSMLNNNETTLAQLELNSHLEQLKNDAKWAYARYINALDLQIVFENYQNHIEWDTGTRDDLYYLPNNSNINYNHYVNSGIARPVYRIESRYLKEESYPADYGLLFPTNHLDDSVSSIKIPSHDFCRVITDVPSNSIISTTKLNSLLEEIHQNGYQETGDIFIYQFIGHSSKESMDTVCIEFTIKSVDSYQK